MKKKKICKIALVLSISMMVSFFSSYAYHEDPPLQGGPTSSFVYHEDPPLQGGPTSRFISDKNLLL